MTAATAWPWSAKLKAFATHIGLSVALLGGALLILLLRWFPAPLDVTDGAGQGIRLLVVVDLVLGPFLTFIAFHPAKTRRALAVDFVFILAVQLSAFGWGLYNIHKVRVQAVAFWQGEFHSVTPDAYELQNLPEDPWQAFGDRAPYLVDVHEPRNDDEISGVATMQMMVGLDPQAIHFLYDAYSPRAESHLAAGYTLEELKAGQPAIAASAQHWLDRHNDVPALRFYPIRGYRTSAAIVLSDEGRWLGGFAGALPVKAAANPPKPEATSPSSPSPKS